jgi:histidine triad (HIT) family protein
MADDCLFCKIVRGEIPCTRVYEDEQVLAFMDIGPIVDGHTLVIPKVHYDPIDQVPDEVLAAVIGVVRRVAVAQRSGLSADGCNVIQNNGTVAGQAVPHVHFHVIPRFEDDGYHWNWSPHEYDDLQKMNALAKKIRAGLAEQ